MHNANCRMQNAESKMQNAKCRKQNTECRMQNAECRMQICTSQYLSDRAPSMLGPVVAHRSGSVAQSSQARSSEHTIVVLMFVRVRPFECWPHRVRIRHTACTWVPATLAWRVFRSDHARTRRTHGLCVCTYVPVPVVRTHPGCGLQQHRSHNVGPGGCA